ncbi:hypothetical protein F5884DRAFT_858825 [Xylogone sp. PMI_703]|nr:hypothetical protein F5884DRAFT_858825 [Xylogone sp. PMI_703]
MSNLTSNPDTYFAQTSAEIIIPKAESDIHSIIGRWSDERLSHPALVVIPSNKDDIIAALKYAASSGLTVVVGGAGHKVVPINDETLYLDMKKFTNIKIDVDDMSVTFGGGVTNNQLLEALHARNLYTAYANSGSVGMVGFCLGGGNSAFSYLHGLAIDNVLEIEGITALGEQVIVGSSSTGEERALFDVLCGAGCGLLAITAMKMRVYPISNLQLEDDKYWVRKWIFPGTAIEKVAEFFNSLPVNKLAPVLIFARSPPSSPAPGNPILIFTLTYFGSSKEAEALVDSLISPEFSKFALTSDTTLAPFLSMFDGIKMFDAHGGFKSQHTARCVDVPVGTIVESYQRWKQFGDEVADARPTTVAFISKFDPSITISNGLSSDPEGRGGRPIAGRDRPVFTQLMMWYRQRESESAAEKYVTEFLSIMRKDDDMKGYAPATLPNNLRDNTMLEAAYTKEQLIEIRRVHRLWNGKGLFYNILEDSGPKM